jgi:hypothetical protein
MPAEPDVGAGVAPESGSESEGNELSSLDGALGPPPLRATAAFTLLTAASLFASKTANICVVLFPLAPLD